MRPLSRLAPIASAAGLLFASIALAVGQPDLVITTGTPTATPGTVLPGGTVTLSAWTVKNQGTVSTGGSFFTGYYLSTDAAITVGDTYLSQSSTSTMAAGASFPWGGPTLTIPANTPAGTYYIGILVDKDNAIAESDETNNYVSVAIVVPQRYTLTLHVQGQGSVVASPANSQYLPGTAVTLTPTAATGWEFDHWLPSGSTADPGIVTMNSNLTVTAVFTQKQYSLTLPVQGQGSVTASPPTGPYLSGTAVTLTPTPATGWKFDHWLLGSAANPATVTMDSNLTITAVFVKTYSLTLPVQGQGAVTASPADGPYTSGTTVTLTPTPAVGWEFNHWLPSGSTANPTSATMISDQTITAVFTQKHYSLILPVQGQGSVTASPEGPYVLGTAVTLTPAPATGWKFDHWLPDGSAVAPASVTMNSDVTLAAVFVQTYSLTLPVQGQGSVTASPTSGPYASGTVVALTATPAADFELDSWHGTDNDASTQLTNNVTMGSDKTVTVSFKEVVLAPANSCGAGTCGATGGGALSLTLIGLGLMKCSMSHRRRNNRG
jgi:hypothetical protein